ncbi:hypothetical protein EMPS_08159 [Entomortierella parvispora]|uniref:Uncharacterized protein n=1 Tax=Entomortierella parvispora TaxID=205924 RepID=A0A9P3HFV3_9FUNG|nr:hypothetical protein EMPS_08159 [Entomortierella parvispora]
MISRPTEGQRRRRRRRRPQNNRRGLQAPQLQEPPQDLNPEYANEIQQLLTRHQLELQVVLQRQQEERHQQEIQVLVIRQQLPTKPSRS